MISETDFKTLFESAPGLYLVLLPDLTIVAVSDTYASATMTKRNEIVGRVLFEVFPDNPDDVTADGVSNLRASLNYVLTNRAQHTMAVQKYDIRRPDGTFEVRYWSPINKPVVNGNGEVIFIIHRVEDVTDFVRMQNAQVEKDKLTDELLRRAEELEMETYKRSQEIQKLNQELEQKVIERTHELETINKTLTDYQTAIDQSSIVSITDNKGVIRHVNDNFCVISKHTREELIGRDPRDFVILPEPKLYKAMIQAIESGKIWKGELKNTFKDGSSYWFDITIVPFLDDNGQPYQFMTIRSDITQRKEAEEKINELNDELEGKVIQRTLELTESLERERSANEMKSRFVSIASHEFRTPLSAILTSASLLEKYTDPEFADKRKKHFERIKLSVRNLTGVLEDFLSIDKLEQGKLEINMAMFDLKEVVDGMKGLLEGMMKRGQSIKCVYEGDSWVMLDKKIVENIVLNLLSNAVKYSPENELVLLTANTEGNKISIRVKDEGIGIPKEEQKNLFGMFYRAKNAETIQGTGLGLTIVKRYVELLDGKISFKSVLDKGTTFTVEFPKG